MTDDNADTDINVLEIDCWNHLQNVWLGGVTKALSSSLSLANTLQEELGGIDSRLRVSTSFDSVLRAVDKEFSLCANYPKGHGELFGEWMKENHPGALLLHVERASGSRQDLAVEGAGAVYMNRKYWIEFLDERLRTPGDNILQENLFVILASLEMTDLARVCSIVHIAICLPTRWLAGNSHKLAEHNWSVRSMGRMVDILESALEAVKEDGGKIIDEAFMIMMGIFKDLMEELPPFEEYWSHVFEKKATQLVGDSSNKVVPLARLRSELFSPQDDTNKDTSTMVGELGVVVATALLTELRDEKKATAEHLSSAGGGEVLVG